MKCKVISHIDVGRNLKRVQNDGLWKFAAEEWWKLMTPYVPMDTGTLSRQVEIRPGEVEYTAPYAHYMYEGRAMGPAYYDPDYGFWSPPGEKKHYTGKKLDLSGGKHPLASAHWDKAAEPVQKPKLIAAMQRYIEKGGLDE